MKPSEQCALGCVDLYISTFPCAHNVIIQIGSRWQPNENKKSLKSLEDFLSSAHSHAKPHIRVQNLHLIFSEFPQKAKDLLAHFPIGLSLLINCVFQLN